jgi:hypothetical protein
MALVQSQQITGSGLGVDPRPLLLLESNRLSAVSRLLCGVGAVLANPTHGANGAPWMGHPAKGFKLSLSQLLRGL